MSTALRTTRILRRVVLSVAILGAACEDGGDDGADTRSETNAATRDLGEVADSFSETATLRSSEDLAGWTARVRSEIDDGRVTVHLPEGARLAYDGAQAFDLEDGHTLVHVPIEGGGAASPSPSGLSVFFDREERVAKYVELQFAADPSSSDQGKLSKWEDGVLVTEQTVVAEGREGGVSTTGWSWGRFNDCLASHGVAAWTITAIGIACTTACIGTLGLGCAACAASVAGISAGVATNCVRKAWK